jgi:sucrose-6-phosphate hydrolase SacC (GH32 family)
MRKNKLTNGIVLSFFLLAAAVCNSCVQQTKSSGESEEFPPEMVRFIASGGNPVFAGTGTDTWDSKIRERGFILYEDSLYKMWYTGYNPEIEEQKFLGYATSEDGVHWTRYAGKPVFSDKWTEDVFVTKNEGTYYMFAEGDHDVAHLLTSSDGINWQERGDLTLLTTAGDTIPGPYGTPAVWIENGKWYLFYERNDSAIWLATSEDRLNWKNVQDEPVLPLGPDQYDQAAVAANQIVKHQGRYYMYYHATSRTDWQDPASPVEWSSNVAVSDDLISWRKYPHNPIVQGDYSSPILVFDGEKPSLYTMHAQVCRYLPE